MIKVIINNEEYSYPKGTTLEEIKNDRNIIAMQR